VSQEIGTAPRGIRLDSGDLGDLAVEARRLLDDAGFADASIIASGGLDEIEIHRLVTAGAPIDGFGVGTALTVSQDHPGLDIVYKLVDYDGRPVAKFSGDKSTFPGAKQVFRPDQAITGDVLSLRHVHEPGEPLLRPAWRDGQRLLEPLDLDAVRERIRAGLRALPDGWRHPPYLERAPMPRIGSDLSQLTEQVRQTAYEHPA
jgi:nicotinate phosphoribosyltransferase